MFVPDPAWLFGFATIMHETRLFLKDWKNRKKDEPKRTRQKTSHPHYTRKKVNAKPPKPQKPNKSI